MSNRFSGVPLSFAFIIILGTNGANTLLLKQYGFTGVILMPVQQVETLAIYIYFQISLAVLLLYPAFDALSDDWPSRLCTAWCENLAILDQNSVASAVSCLVWNLYHLDCQCDWRLRSVYALTSGNYNVITIRIASLVSERRWLVLRNWSLAAAIFRDFGNSDAGLHHPWLTNGWSAKATQEKK